MKLHILIQLPEQQAETRARVQTSLLAVTLADTADCASSRQCLVPLVNRGTGVEYFNVQRSGAIEMGATHDSKGHIKIRVHVKRSQSHLISPRDDRMDVTQSTRATEQMWLKKVPCLN